MKIKETIAKKQSDKYRVKELTIKEGDNLIWSLVTKYPEHWSENAATIFASKYFRRVAPLLPMEKEMSVSQVFERMCKHWTETLSEKYGFTDSECTAYYNEMYGILYHQYAAPNSPQFFNTGVKYTGVLGKDNGFWYYDKEQKKSVPSPDSYSRVNANACYILDVNDDLLGEGGILDLVKNEARIFKFGSGAGSNWHRIRGKEEPLSGGGFGSGVVAFMSIADQNAKSIKSGGAVRRAAIMRMLPIDHPDIMDFITWKGREERKAKALIAMGYDSRYDGEAYSTVSGQQSNNSIVITDAFMAQVRDGFKNDKHELVCRTHNELHQQVSAKGLWDAIINQAYECADPGLFFGDVVNRWHMASHIEPIYSSNPCCEYLFLNNTACNLASINLVKFWDNATKTFNWEEFVHAVRLLTITLDATVEMSHYPTKEIAERSYKTRTIGIGFTSLGSLLMLMGYQYGSEEAMQITSKISAIMTASSYLTSIELAEKVGACEYYNKDVALSIMKKHRNYYIGNVKTDDVGTTPFDNIITNLETGAKLRNLQVTCIAPCGTIGLIMDNDTMGIEPDFSLVKYKTLAGGGVVKYVNQTVPQALENLGYRPDQITSICSWIENKGTIIGSELQTKHYPIFKVAKGTCEEDTLSPMDHLNMMQAVQPFISGGISKTVNMPANATREDVSNIYLKAWEMGLKAITIYRDGCKDSQPLSCSLDGGVCGTGEIIEH